jgi:nitric oxide dioxygenase
MTPEQIQLVRSSFAKVAPIAEPAAAMFYDRLFTLDPSLRPLFKGDMAEQGRKLMTMIGAAVANLHQMGELTPTVRALAVRHVGYGVEDTYYQTVGTALLWTLEQGLGDGFTPAVRDAWTVCYGTLSAEMMAAAAEART